ncbi:diguanylate cyclase (GGDEF)-like protein [Rhodovulum steppense]|uniref:Diguanylate cyclase (GGDEF)-like protein n=2 Tax=Rhodovulum steppense TaxID=540251 RepID=A0A4R1YHZ1_9RHOB|nr:diguanylate cyclase (GGDEF)-like protein [Rhodovulum steppense]
MKRFSFTKKIVLAVSAVLVAFVGTMWILILSMRNTMDERAFEDSLRLMDGRVRSTQEQVALIASDYHNWTDVFAGAMRGDIEMLATNYGITAARGDVFEYAAMFDGPFYTPVAWVVGQGLSPQPVYLSEETMEAIRAAVPGLVIAQRETFDFFLRLGDQLVMSSASYLLPEDPDLRSDSDQATLAIATIGKVLDPERLRRIERELSVSELVIRFDVPPKGKASLPLLGASLEPVAYLSWRPPTPGTSLFDKVFTILLGVTVVLVGGATLAGHLLHSSAKALMQKEAEAADLARTDALTGLPNRLALRENLSRITSQYDGEVAVLVLDLDRFKQVNDVIGHTGGDVFLQIFAERVQAVSDKNCFVARNGGDEFVIVIWAQDRLAGIVDAKVARLEELFSSPIRCHGFLFDVFVSKGIAYSRSGEHSADELLRRADRAMYTAKALQLQEPSIYDEEMRVRDLKENSIEKALRSALLRKNEFSIVYQPIVDAKQNDRLLRLEALARWESPMIGRVSPAEFIPVAETRGLMIALGWHILELVCRDLKETPGLRVSVNVSPIQLMAPRFANEFCSRVLSYGVDSERIDIELTESVALRDEVMVSEQLHILRAAGFSISLDDFGTGFTSIGYLGRMPFNSIKIDRSFLAVDEQSDGDFSIIDAMIALSHSMGMTVVAEGVEEEAELVRLRDSGCDYLQGYLLGRPGPLSSISLEFTTAAA